jgi:hypothetical protein
MNGVIAGWGMTTFGGDRTADGALMAVVAVVFVPVWLGVGATQIRQPSLA